MDLQYGKSTPYTTGKQVIPSGSTIEDVSTAIESGSTEKKFKEIFVKISETYESGDFTPQSKNDGSWDSNLTPVESVATLRGGNPGSPPRSPRKPPAYRLCLSVEPSQPPNLLLYAEHRSLPRDKYMVQ
ncbi:unnamed protein product [Leptidea sinapis]|uniref:Uncharacterized protein n=1 Tax=Leptidea sinapis TaxID=189913 RepID=A0A5E4QI66_9NEOP|nr:unnamed protein product [Leptidea sinapis]